MSDSTAVHRRQAADDEHSARIACAVLTVSDSRTIDTDTSGSMIVEMLTDAGHTVFDRRLTADEPDLIRETFLQWSADPAVQAVLSTGGTGIGRRDQTVDILKPMLTKELEGFGELFRMVSYEDIGPASMLSRALAGFIASDDPALDPTVVFAMPGSSNAVRTAMTKLILPELSHVVWQCRH
jgi:molybdenum cofactor biosynthesis protein B